MPNGYGRGFGRGRGMGFGFRGSSPPWPYIGRGRGGLPRCGYPYGAVPAPPAAWAYPPPSPGMPFDPGITREQELACLADEADAIKAELEHIESRMNELEKEQEE